MYADERSKLINRLKGLVFSVCLEWSIKHVKLQKLKRQRAQTKYLRRRFVGWFGFYFLKLKRGVSNQPCSGRREYARWAEHAPPNAITSQPLGAESHISLPDSP